MRDYNRRRLQREVLCLPVKVYRDLAAVEPPARKFKKKVFFPEFTGLPFFRSSISLTVTEKRNLMAPSDGRPSVSGLMARRWDGLDQSWSGSDSYDFRQDDMFQRL